MKNFLAVILCCAMLCGAACGKAEPVAESTEPSTIEIEITTEEETTTEAATTVFVPMSGESNGVTWRTLDLEDKANAATCKWLEEWYFKWEPYPFSKPQPIQLSRTKTVYRKEPAYREGQLILRDEITGKETVLLEDTYYGEEDDALADEVYWKRPIPAQAIDNRFFVVLWGGWAWECGVSVYDIKEMREIPIENDIGYMGNYFRTYGNHVYLCTPGDDGGYYGSFSLQKAVVTPKLGETLIAVELLQDYPGADIDIGWLGWTELSPDERYYAAVAEEGALICDIKERKSAWRIPFPAWDAMGACEWNDPEALSFSYPVFRDANTVYYISGDRRSDNDSNVVEANVNRYVLEITLPRPTIL